MKPFRTSAAILLALFGLAMAPIQQPAPAAVDVTGLWAAAFETPIGEMKYTYELKVAVNGTLTGEAVGPLGKSPLTEGTVKGDVVTFVEMMDGAIKVVYTGTIVSKDEIKFSRAVGDFGTEELVARRSASPAR